MPRNRFVERAVEAFQANAQSESDFDRRNQAKPAKPANQGNPVQRAINESHQSAAHVDTSSSLQDLQQLDHQTSELQREVNRNQQSAANRTSNPLISELQVRLRARNNATQQITNIEPLAEQSQRVRIRSDRPRRLPRPQSIDMRSALAKFREMEIQNEPNYLANSLPRPNSRTGPAHISLEGLNRPCRENVTVPDPTRPDTPSPGTSEENLIAFSDLDSSDVDSVSVESSSNVESSFNQSLMVDIADAESIGRLVEFGFEESDATNAFFATGRNLEATIDLLLQQNSTD